MQTFLCRCQNRIFFENDRCTKCNAELGFFPKSMSLSALVEPDPEGWFVGPSGERAKKCERYGNACNWMVDEADGQPRCRACRLNQMEPTEAAFDQRPNDGGDTSLRDKSMTMEAAKRRLLFTLYRLGLDVVGKDQDPEHGLAFALTRHDPENPKKAAITGHADGLITLNLDEADPSLRERTRLRLGEHYRTVLGHFRHESGHYFWDVLVSDKPPLAEFRQLFGDETIDYGESLKKHYAEAAPFDPNTHVTPYATMHPWEDFAETWAHYLHLVDTWETAQSFGVAPVLAPASNAFEGKLAQWSELMIALNSLNRAMGQPDAYPFSIGSLVAKKLAFVERLIEGSRGGPRGVAQ